MFLFRICLLDAFVCVDSTLSVGAMNFDASAYVNVGVWEPDPDDSDLEDDEDETPGESI